MGDKNLKYYLLLNYPMIVRWDTDDKVFFVEFPDLPGCMAHGKTPTNAVNLAQEIKKEWLKEALSSGISIPEPKAEGDYSGRFVVRISSALHRRLSEQAASEGRSLNSHTATLLSERSASLMVEKALAGVVNTIKEVAETAKITGNSAAARMENAAIKVETCTNAYSTSMRGEESFAGTSAPVVRH